MYSATKKNNEKEGLKQNIVPVRREGLKWRDSEIVFGPRRAHETYCGSRAEQTPNDRVVGAFSSSLQLPIHRRQHPSARRVLSSQRDHAASTNCDRDSFREPPSDVPIGKLPLKVFTSVLVNNCG